MIDFSQEVSELEECKKKFDTFGQRLFDLSPDVTEEEFSTQEMFALGAQIIYVRKRVADIIVAIKDRLEDEGDFLDLEQDDDDDFMEKIHEAFDDDHDLLWTVIEEIAVLKRNHLSHSFIERYQDILLNVMKYCKTGDKKCLQKKFRDIPAQDML